MAEVLSMSLMFLWVAMPALVWGIRLVSRKRIHGALLYVLTVVVCYVLFVACAWTADVVLEQRMNSFDLDGDGGIGGVELTPEAQQAIDDWASDTGRTFAPIVGGPLSAFWAAVCMIPLCIGEWIVKRFIGRGKREDDSDGAADVLRNDPSSEGNPYSSPGTQ
ncbi:MAG: hypothetical protein KDB27_16570 [Planctomycetales bacterium]|nr:hypothetical protein [Planctomycetales bacterium]